MKNWKNNLLFVLIGLIGLLGSLYLYRSSLKNLAKYEQKELDKETENFVQILRERINRNMILLTGIQSYFAGSSEVTFSEWNTYLDGMHFSEEFPAIRFCAVIEETKQTQLPALIERVHRLGIPDYAIWPQTTNEQLMPITYIYPIAFKKWLGFDICSNTALCSNFKDLTKQDGISFSSSFEFEDNQLNPSDISVWIPLATKPSTPPQVILAHIDLPLLMGQVTKQMKMNNVNILLYRENSSNSPHLLFSQTLYPSSAIRFESTHLFHLGKETLKLQCQTIPGNHKGPAASYPIIVLSFSLAVTIFLVIFIYFLNKRRYTLSQDIVTIKKEADKEALLGKTILKSLTYSVICTDPQGLILIFNKAAEDLLGYSAGEMIGKKTLESFHDTEEMKARAKELSELLGRPILPNFEVFIALAVKGIPDERVWKYIRKDQSVVEVLLTVCALRDSESNLIGYMGVAKRR